MRRSVISTTNNAVVREFGRREAGLDRSSTVWMLALTLTLLLRCLSVDDDDDVDVVNDLFHTTYRYRICRFLLLNLCCSSQQLQ
jgi:hypothetical protein